jgi:hypothetical protein
MANLPPGEETFFFPCPEYLSVPQLPHEMTEEGEYRGRLIPEVMVYFKGDEIFESSCARPREYRDTEFMKGCPYRAGVEDPTLKMRLMVRIVLNQDFRYKLSLLDKNEVRIPEKILAILARDSDQKVRLSLVERSELPESILMTLYSYESDFEVRKALALRDDVPDWMLEAMEERERYPEIRAIASEQLEQRFRSR